GTGAGPPHPGCQGPRHGRGGLPEDPPARPPRQAGRPEQESTMGKLVVTEFITLDGIIEDPGGSDGTEHGGWSFRHPAPEGQQFKGEELERADAQLLGRVTYEGLAAAWPSMEESTGELGHKMESMAQYDGSA